MLRPKHKFTILAPVRVLSLVSALMDSHDTNLGTLVALLVEDDTRIAALIGAALARSGIVVTTSHTSAAARAELRQLQFDVVILDVLLPDGSGIGLCKEIRSASDVPVLILSALGEEDDRVRGLEAGADDYIVKPFLARELLARIHSAVRRCRGLHGPRYERVVAGSLELDPTKQQATLDGRLLDLTSREFALLQALASRPGQILTRDELLNLTQGSADLAFGRSIDVHISKLRGKLGDDSRQPQLLKTVRGRGYLWAGGL